MTDYKEKMQKALDNLQSDFSAIRAGRANPHILDKLKVDPTFATSPVITTLVDALSLLIYFGIATRLLGG